jgi:hypothetical protein
MPGALRLAPIMDTVGEFQNGSPQVTASQFYEEFKVPVTHAA